MKWKAAKHGDTRIKTIFPIIPKNIQGIFYWLERVRIKQEYTEWGITAFWDSGTVIEALSEDRKQKEALTREQEGIRKTMVNLIKRTKQVENVIDGLNLKYIHNQITKKNKDLLLNQFIVHDDVGHMLRRLSLLLIKQLLENNVDCLYGHGYGIETKAEIVGGKVKLSIKYKGQRASGLITTIY